MRIIAGEFRGRRLQAPAGMGTRPTTDRVRESLMSSLASLREGFEDAIVLDAFAGSGALGLEALSRGAKYARFVDADAGAVRTIQANIRELGLSARRANVGKADAFASLPPVPHGPYNVVFLDPPYRVAPADVIALVGRLASSGRLAQDAVIVYEHDAAHQSLVNDAVNEAGFLLATSKKYRDTVIDIFRSGPR